MWGAYIRGGTYIWNELSVSICGGLIFAGGLYSRGAYIWNELSVSICGGLIFGGGLYLG